jgi:hypothetical protein
MELTPSIKTNVLDYFECTKKIVNVKGFNSIRSNWVPNSSEVRIEFHYFNPKYFDKIEIISMDPNSRLIISTRLVQIILISNIWVTQTQYFYYHSFQ